MSPALIEITSAEAYDAWMRANPSGVVHFYASWCEPCAAMDALMTELAKAHAGSASFARCDAEAVEDVCEREGVSSVPYFVFTRDGRRVDAHEGADAAVVTNKTKQFFPRTAAMATMATTAMTTTTTATSDALNARLKSLIESQPVVVFMKGHPDEPKCGFSRKVVEALKTAGVKFGSFNILADNDVREGLKVYSSWPSYPQVYVDGELVGGCDIILELAEAGELKEACSSKESKVQNAINDRIKSMLAAQDVILFMKGTRTEPRCGFSAKVVQALDAIGVEYETFDILQDEPIRQGLKEYSQWPTYPQCFYKSELIGGCDIILEMAAEGSLAAELGVK
jgi:Grx4 family monothiol glutaredoxin